MKLAVVSNILTPYRIPLFEAMRKLVDGLHVLLMVEQEENREWKLGAVPFEYEVLPGVHLKLPAAEVSLHVNYGVMRALQRVNPDVVLSGGFAPANLAAWFYCRLHRRSFVGWGELSMQDVRGASILRRGLRHVMTTWSDGAIASSSEARDVFLHYGVPASRILTSPMSIDVEFFHAGVMAGKNSTWYQMERTRSSTPILLSVGRLIDAKGYRELFAMYELVLDRRPDTSLLIVGDGPERATYEAHVRSKGWAHVHFLGFRQADELIKFLGLADVFVFHTLSDTFGAVLAEAMAAELPVVSSVHAAATRDLIDDGVTGFRIDPRDAERSAHAILHVLTMTPSERAALGRAAYERVRRHDIDSTADHMVDFLRSFSPANKRPAQIRLPTKSVDPVNSRDV